MKDRIQKVIDLYESSCNALNGVSVYVNEKPIDVDFTSISYVDDTFFFDFGDDEIENIQFTTVDISDIIFDKIANMNISIIKLISGDTILICNL